MPHTKESLEALSRVDLQKLCKGYGVKANLKSEALIDLILDASPAPPAARRTRCASTRQSSRASTRTTSDGGNPSNRVSSVIIHDLQPEECDEEAENTDDEPALKPIAPPRTRKAKESQKKLGVGKPKVAGGSGARTVTGALSPSKGRRGRSNRSTIPTIIEEETVTPSTPGLGLEIQHRAREDPESSSDSSELQLLKGQINELRVQLDGMSALHRKVEALSAQVEQLQSHVSVFSGAGNPIAILPRQNQMATGDALNQFAAQNHVPSPLPSISEEHPGIAPILLGKRQRDSPASDILTAHEPLLSRREDDTEIIRPSKKRQRFDEQSSEAGSSSNADLSLDLPPTTHLPQYFTPKTETREVGDFDFGIGHTPSVFTTFAFPEAPQSPTPVGRGEGLMTKQLKSYMRPVTTINPAETKPPADPMLLPSGSDIMTLLGGHDTSQDRTMYGTELHSDARFGDVGLDNAQSSLWKATF